MADIRSIAAIRSSCFTSLRIRDPMSGAMTMSTSGPGPVFLKRGDSAPSLVVQLGGCPVDPTGGTVQFMMRLKGSLTPKVNAAASFVGDPTVNNLFVQYDWQAGDTDTAGDYEAEFEITVDGRKISFPNTGYLGVTILDDIA